MKRYQIFLICLGLLGIIVYCLFNAKKVRQIENFQTTFSPILTATQAARFSTSPISDEVSGVDENNSTHFITQNPNEITSNMPTSRKSQEAVFNQLPDYVKTELKEKNIDIGSDDEFTKRVILDKKFREKNPQLYDSIIKTILQNYLKPNIQDNLSYTLTITNENCKDCSFATNLVNSLSTVSPNFMNEVHNNLNAGSTKLGYPHPSYAILNEFKALSTCNYDCKPTRTSQCPPQPYNCLTQNDKIS